MNFRLYYRGKLKANSGPKEKQGLREVFHCQLKDLWGQAPLSDLAKNFLDPKYELSAIKEIKDWKFSSIVNSNNHLVAKLDITFLCPEEPGKLVRQGGDIDNRLKTLLDALSLPQENQIANKLQIEEQTPLHCLLEDDKLIVGLSVSVDRLLDCQDKSEVVLIIHVDISPIKLTLGNIDISN